MADVANDVIRTDTTPPKPDAEQPKKAQFGVLYKYSTRNERWLLALASFCAFCEGAAMPAFTYVFGTVLDAVGTDGADLVHQMDILAFAMLGIAGGVFLLGTTWSSLFNYTAVKQANRLRRAYLASVLSKDIAWFDLHTPGEIPSHLSADIDKFQGAIAQKAGNGLMNLSQAISGVILGFVSGWAVALVVLAGIPFISVATMMLTKSMTKASTATQASYAKAGSVAEEVLMSIRTVASFGGELFELNRYTSHLGTARKSGTRMGVQVGLSLGLVMMFVFCSYALTFWFGAWLIDNRITNSVTGDPWKGSEVIVVFFALLMGSFGLSQLGPSFSAFAEGTAALKGLFETIEAASSIEPSMLKKRPDGAMVCDKTWGSSEGDKSKIVVERLEIKNATFHYPTRPDVMVLNGVSLTIAAGQKVALVGESGSGKSTIISLLERFYDPMSGSVSINGIDIKTMPTRSLRSLFGYVGQEPVMFATTIRANLTYGLRGSEIPSDDVIMKTLKMANVHAFIMSLPEKLDTYCGPGGSQMSGGQKQRIAIARALLRDPQVLLLDEATSALDNESEKLVQETIDSLQNLSNLTTISVAHRLSTVKNSDVIFVLQRGELQEQGSHTELMAKPTGVYRALVATQATSHQGGEDSGSAIASRKASSLDESSPVFAKSTAAANPITTKTDKTTEQKELERTKAISKKYKIPWGRLLSFTKQEKWLYLPAILGAFAKGAAFPIHAMMFSSVISWYYEKTDLMAKVSIVSIKYVGLGVGVFLGIVLDIGAFAYISESFTQRIRAACFRHILGQNVGFFDHPDNAPSKLQLALSEWASKMNSITTNVVGVFFEVIAALTAGFVIAFLASPKLAGIIAACMPLIIGSSIVMTAVMLGTGKDEHNMSKQAAMTASEAVQNMRTVRALNAEMATLELYEKFAMRKVVDDSRKAWISGLSFGFAMASAFLPYAIGYFVAGRMIEAGELNLENMSKALVGLLLGAMSAGQALSFLPDVAIAKTAAHDMFVLLDTPSSISPYSTAAESADAVMGDGVIEFDNVCFAYPQRPDMPVLKGLSFTVKRGQKVALVGPSGSGKSSIVALLQRFYDPSTGSVKLGSRDLKSIDVSSLRSIMGFVGQEPVLFDTTMENNVRYGNQSATDADLERVKIQAKLDFVNPENVQWSTVLGPKGGLLSGGQKQRTAIARALIRDPKILLLDEATSALDSASEHVVQKAIDEATVGRTTFVIAHRLSTIVDADVILVIADGRMVEQGTHTELMSMKSVYYQLYLKGQK